MNLHVWQPFNLNLDIAQNRQVELIESIERRQIISELNGSMSLVGTIRSRISGTLIAAGKVIQPAERPEASEPVFDSNIMNLAR